MMLQKTILKYKTIVHSIPIGSMLTLLLCSLCLFNPQLFSNDNDVYAIEEENIDNSSNDESNSKTTYTNNTNLSTRANTITPTATLSIDGNVNDSTSSTAYSNPGDTVYLTHNVDVKVNDVVGYNLSISYGADSNNTLNYEGSSHEPPTITGANNVIGNSLADNTWGYHWDTNSTSSNDDNSNNTESLGQLSYSTMPDYNNSNTILTESNSTNTAYNKTINGKLIFAAKFSEDAPYGHYKTSVLLSLAATPQTITTYTITYNCNGGSNCPENVSENSTDLTYTYTIPNITPTKTNYTFLGYNTNNSTTADANYAPGRTITINSSSPSLTLYAVWEQLFKEFPSDLTTMQEMTSSICSNADIGAKKTLTDIRDNYTYTIQKLEDGKCWMISNLRLSGQSLIANSHYDRTLTSADSNLVNDYIVPQPTNAWYGYSDDNNKALIYFNGSMANGANYSWCAATAGFGRYCDEATTIYDDSIYSICSRGWRLPTRAEYNILLNKGYDDKDTIRVNKGLTIGGAFFPAAGAVYNGSLTNVNLEGQYWSGTAYYANQAYRLYFGSDSVITDLASRYIGASIRCIAQ